MTDPWYDEETQQHYKLAPYENGIGLFSCNADGSSGYHYRPIRGEDRYGDRYGDELLRDKLDDRWSTEQILARRVAAIEERSLLLEQELDRYCMAVPAAEGNIG